MTNHIKRQVIEAKNCLKVKEKGERKEEKGQERVSAKATGKRKVQKNCKAANFS